MNWLKSLLTSSIGKKFIMSLSGLFLTLFLIAHLVGNLQLLIDDGGKAFNIYADFMMNNPAIQIVAWITKVIILLHVVYSLWLTRQNQAARPEGYAMNKPNKTSHWTSRFMPPIGIVILIFIVIHLINFWARAHWGPIQDVTYDGNTMGDLYTIVLNKFQVEWVVIFYVLSMLFIAFHLWHGVKSAFQTIGWRHPKYYPLISNTGALLAVVMPALFALIPVYMYIMY